MSIVLIAVIGVTAVLLAVPLKSLKSEYGLYLGITAALFIFLYGLGKLSGILEAIRQMEESIPISHSYLHSLLKMAGITYVAEFASGICRDAGYSAIGMQIEIFGKLSILAVSMPILLALLETLKNFMKM
ncbi:MAG: SpoIIIAC/SpoIIIAD family protein [bacterium]|nr:SpoIIIAC/SpoIIIAD family protein [bacterium]